MAKKKLTEHELRLIIRESIDKILNENQEGLLLDMDLPRKTYKVRISNLTPQLLENWCLVRYATKTTLANGTAWSYANNVTFFNYR